MAFSLYETKYTEETWPQLYKIKKRRFFFGNQTYITRLKVAIDPVL